MNQWGHNPRNKREVDHKTMNHEDYDELQNKRHEFRTINMNKTRARCGVELVIIFCILFSIYIYFISIIFYLHYLYDLYFHNCIYNLIYVIIFSFKKTFLDQKTLEAVQHILPWCISTFYDIQYLHYNNEKEIIIIIIIPNGGRMCLIFRNIAKK